MTQNVIDETDEWKFTMNCGCYGMKFEKKMCTRTNHTSCMIWINDAIQLIVVYSFAFLFPSVNAFCVRVVCDGAIRAHTHTLSVENLHC